MTPYEKTKDLLAKIEALAADRSVPLPDERYTQMGGQVVACEGLIVALARITVADGYDSTCGPIQAGDFIITLARSCAIVYEDTGIDDVEELEKVSLESDKDVDLLWSFATDLVAWGLKTWSVTNTLLGGLSVTTLSLTTGID